MLAAIGAAGPAWGAAAVAISATAAPEYQRTEPGRGEVRVETYVFTQGRHFDGSSRDSGVEKTPFVEIAKTLAPGLARQNYFPAKDPDLAELMIVVHWGATQVYDDPEKQFTTERLNSAIAAYSAQIAAMGNADSTELSQALSSRNSAATQQERTIAANAALLGYETSLAKEGASLMASTDEITMRVELAEERYFVILMAYDYQALKKEKKRKLLWVTRMSVRSPGNNFTGAMPAMTRAASDFFGKQQDTLARVNPKLRDTRIEVGLPTVVPAEAPASTSVAPKK